MIVDVVGGVADVVVAVDVVAVAVVVGVVVDVVGGVANLDMIGNGYHTIIDYDCAILASGYGFSRHDMLQQHVQEQLANQEQSLTVIMQQQFLLEQPQHGMLLP